MSRYLNQTERSVSWFTLIGAAAALVHYVIAVGLESYIRVSPSWANVSGFCCAFFVSYFGHRTLSFPSQNMSHQQSFPRFLAVALLGFAANQTLLLLGLRYTSFPFWLVLGVVMVAVAMSTYLLSRHWVFSST